MAPEQLRGEPVDARSDVFSLGCVLYELLSLRSPFAAETEQQIRQKVLAAAPEPLRSVHPGLPWEATVVCSTAMAPEAGRRYASAAALADDLHALLHSRPIAARRAGPLLRTARWSRRHPALASALTVLGLGLVSTTWFALEARAEAERSGQQEALAKATAEANARLAREQTALAAAEARAKDEARRHAAAAAARADDLEQILKFQGKRWLADDVPRMGLALRRALLQRSPASRGAGLETALTGTDFASVVIDLLQEQVLEPSRAAIEREVEQPTVKARLLQGIADALRLYGRPSAAEAPQQQAYKLAMEHFAESDPARASALTGMALQLQDTGRLGEAEPLLRKALSLREQHLGADDDETISSMALLAKLLGLRGQFAEHESLGQEVLDRCLRVHGDDHEQTIRARQNIGVRLHNSGRSLEAEPMLREAAAAAQRTLGAEHPLTLFCMHSHATCLESLGNTREAEPLHQQTLAARRRILGDDHPQTLSSLDTLAVLLARRGDAAAAESMLRETLDRRRRLLGDSHQDLVVPANNLGAFLRSKNRHEEALEPLRLAQSAAVDSLGHEHPHTLRATRDLVEALTKCRKDEEVVRVVEATLAARPRALDELDVETAAMVGRLALLRMERTDFTGALPLLRSLVTFLGKTQGNQDPATLQYVTMLGSALLQTSQAQEARHLMAPFESAARQAFGAGPRRLLLARFLELLGRALGSEATEAAHQQAEARLLEAHRILVGQPAAPPDMRRRVVMGMLELYQAWQRVDPTPGREAQIAEWRAALADLETRK
jgi:serine/threonine protein kinase